MKKHKGLIYILATAVGLLVLAAGILFGMRIRMENGAFCVGRSLMTPYSYMLYDDHAVLEKYYGKKYHAQLPKTILGKPVTEIGYECFAENDYVETVELNQNIEVIGVRAFAECENLAAVTGGERVKRIEECAFDLCRKLETVEIGTQLESIGLGAFSMCEALRKLEPQDNLQSIGDIAFADSGLEEFAFNDKAEIGSNVFDGTAWTANHTEKFIIDGAGNLIGCTGSEETIVIPDGVRQLNGGCFQGTTAKEIYLPETVTTICDLVFADCSDLRVYIPGSVVQMGDKNRKYRMDNPIMNDDAAITIITTQDSYALQYAKENGVPCEIVEEILPK